MDKLMSHKYFQTTIFTCFISKPLVTLFSMAVRWNLGESWGKKY